MEEIPKFPNVEFPDGKTGVFDNSSDVYHGLDGHIVDYDNLILTSYLKQNTRKWASVFQKDKTRLQKQIRKNRKYIKEDCPKRPVKKIPDVLCQRFVEIPYVSAFHQPGGKE